MASDSPNENLVVLAFLFPSSPRQFMAPLVLVSDRCERSSTQSVEFLELRRGIWMMLKSSTTRNRHMTRGQRLQGESPPRKECCIPHRGDVTSRLVNLHGSKGLTIDTPCLDL